MASVNHLILVGNCGRDPETKTFPSGDKQATVSVATTETWKDKQSGEKREATEWHRLVFNGALAGIVEQYVRKGSQIYVEGSIKTRKYNDKDGVEKSIVEIRVDKLKLLGGRPDGAGAPAQRAAAPAPRPQGGGGGGVDDDIPFNRFDDGSPF